MKEFPWVCLLVDECMIIRNPIGGLVGKSGFYAASWDRELNQLCVHFCAPKCIIIAKPNIFPLKIPRDCRKVLLINILPVSSFLAFDSHTEFVDLKGASTRKHWQIKNWALTTPPPKSKTKFVLVFQTWGEQKRYLNIL